VKNQLFRHSGEKDGKLFAVEESTAEYFLDPKTMRKMSRIHIVVEIEHGDNVKNRILSAINDSMDVAEVELKKQMLGYTLHLAGFKKED